MNMALNPNQPQGLAPLPSGGLVVNPQALIQRVKDIETVRDAIMQEGLHYYSLQNKKVKLPDGTEKEVPQYSLGKAGAETLILAFGLRSEIRSDVVCDDPQASMVIVRDQWTDGPNGRIKVPMEVKLHGSYEVKSTCTLYAPNGSPIASASGNCNSWESAFRSHATPDAKNPVLKRAEKRALVAATLMATGCSSMFGQDLEDMPESMQPGATAGSSSQKAGATNGTTTTSGAYPNGLSEKQCNLAYVKAKGLLSGNELNDFSNWFKALPKGGKAALDDLCAGGEKADRVVAAWKKSLAPKAESAAAGVTQ